MHQITLDYGNMMAAHLDGRGVDPAALEGALERRFREALADLERWKEEGELGFLDLPYATETVERVRETADGFGQWFEDLVVIGIGGSSLGTVLLRDALLGPDWNQRSDEEREWFPRLHVLDNPDPDTVDALLSRLDVRRTLFNVVSKSGSTAETMALYLVARDRVAAEVEESKVRGHFLFTTDPGRGALREIGKAEGVPTLPVPANVGGRFSVLSPVGLFPAAVCGVDVEALLQGAGRMADRARGEELSSNPAGLVAALLHHADTELGAPIHVMMPYVDRLRTLALWFQQLWAESLGKERDRKGEVVESGPTPLPALGAVDQHAQLQLFMEGPRDKVVLFVSTGERSVDVAIPERHPEIDALGYLGGHTLGELLDAELRATAEALRRRGRPNLTLDLGGVTPAALGETIMLFQVATVLAGALYGVNPLDQPGVELGKRLTYGLMGRAGHDAPVLRHVDPRWRV